MADVAKQPHSEQEKAILEVRDTFEGRASAGRQELLRNCYENWLFYLGYHWLVFDRVTRRFRQENTKKNVPRPVTNMFKAKLDELIAIIARTDPSLTFAPSNDSEQDRITAKYARLFGKYAEKVNDMDELRREAAPAFVLANNIYFISGWDMQAGPKETQPRFTCASHPEVNLSATEALMLGGRCPNSTAQAPEPLQPSKTKFDDVSPGQLTTQVGTPFNVWVNLAVKRMEDQPVAMVRDVHDVDMLKRYYPEAADFLSYELGTEDVGMNYLHSLMRLTPSTGFLGMGGGVSFHNAITADQVYILPGVHKALPEGAWAKIAGGRVILEKIIPYPFHDGNEKQPGRPFIPIAHAGYDTTGVTHVATGPADHLRAPQRRRNRLQSKIELWTARSANGVWAIPVTGDIKTPEGEEGAIIRWDPRGAQGARPDRIDGGRLPQGVENQFIEIDQEMDAIVGMTAILRGDTPGRVDSAMAIARLNEQAHGRFAAMLKGWAHTHKKWLRHQFYIFRNFAPDQVFFAIKGEHASWTVNKLKRAQLYGGIDMDVEPGSEMPKTTLQKRAAFEQALQYDPTAIQDPATKIKYLRSLGVPELMSEYDADDEVIAREHDRFIEWARKAFTPEGKPLFQPGTPESMAPIMVDQEIDNHPQHYVRHRAFIQSEEFESLPPPAKQIFRLSHFNQHLIMMQAMMSGMANQTIAPPEVAMGGGQPQAETATENGRGYAGREDRKATAKEGQ